MYSNFRVNLAYHLSCVVRGAFLIAGTVTRISYRYASSLARQEFPLKRFQNARRRAEMTNRIIDKLCETRQFQRTD